MTEAVAPCSLISVMYTYDERDRLLTETRLSDQTCSIRMNPDGTYIAYMTPKPSAWNGYALIGFSFVSMVCLFAPFAFLGSGPLGVRARRRWRRTTAMALAMIPLFIVGPEAIAQLYNQAALHRAAEAGMVTALGVATVETEFAYDTNGNQNEKKIDGIIQGQYLYDSENRLIQFANPQQGVSNIVNYSYDDDGIRNAKSVGGVVTTFTTDKNQPYAQVLEERDEAGALKVSYTYGHDLISQSRETTDTRYYHYDGQMSTRNLTNTDADPALVAVTDSYIYSPYGNLRDSTETTFNDYLYTGEQYDASLDNYYLRARYYDQGAGRFTGRDLFEGRLRDPVTLHRYMYVGADPVNNVDPSGYFFTALGALKVAAISGFIVGSILGGITGGWKGAFLGGLESAFKAAAFTALLLGAGAVIGLIWGLELVVGFGIAAALAFVGDIGFGVRDIVNASSPDEAAFLTLILALTVVLTLAGTRRALAGSGGPKKIYEILDGVRRSKASWLQGKARIRAKIYRNGKLVGEEDILIDSLRSPKGAIEIRDKVGRDRMMNALKGAYDDTLPPIDVEEGAAGTRIAYVLMDTGT